LPHVRKGWDPFIRKIAPPGGGYLKRRAIPLLARKAVLSPLPGNFVTFSFNEPTATGSVSKHV
jgi:hypothetical protein